MLFFVNKHFILEWTYTKKMCEDNTQSSNIPLTLFPLSLTFYISLVYFFTNEEPV